jgi:hypothetical protein
VNKRCLNPWRQMKINHERIDRKQQKAKQSNEGRSTGVNNKLENQDQSTIWHWIHGNKSKLINEKIEIPIEDQNKYWVWIPKTSHAALSVVSDSLSNAGIMPVPVFVRERTVSAWSEEPNFASGLWITSQYFIGWTRTNEQAWGAV